MTAAPLVPPTEERSRRYPGWRVVGALALTETVSWGVLYYAFAVLQVPMGAELGFSPVTLTGAYSLALLVTGAAAVPVGRWLDRHGPHALMTAGSVGAVVVVLAWSRVQTVAGLYAVFAGIGLVSAAVLYEPAFATVVRWFVERRSTALLVVTVAAGFASTIFLPLTDALVGAHGWRSALVVLAAVLAVTTVLPHAVALRLPPPSVPDPRPVAGLRGTAGWAVRDGTFRWLTLGMAAQTLAVVVIAVHLVPFLLEQGHSATFAATATGALGVLSVTGRLLFTGLAASRPTAVVTAAVFALQAVAVVVLAATGGTTAGAVVAVLLFGLGFGVGTIARPELVAQALGGRSYATVAALLGTVATAAKTAGPVSAGLLRGATGSYAPVLGLTAAGCALAAYAVHRAGRRLPAPAPAPARPTGGGDDMDGCCDTCTTDECGTCC